MPLRIVRRFALAAGAAEWHFYFCGYFSNDADAGRARRRANPAILWRKNGSARNEEKAKMRVKKQYVN
jgi:hypothetical protein